MSRPKTYREKMIDERFKNAEDGNTFDMSLGHKSLVVPDDFKVFDEDDTYIDHHFDNTFPIDESEELMSYIREIKHLIETQYTFKGTSFYEIYNQTDKLYKHYCSLFLDIKIPNKKIHRERIRIFTILTGVLYPYYIQKNGPATPASQEEFIMCVLFYYFTISHRSNNAAKISNRSNNPAARGIIEVYRMIKYNIPVEDRYKLFKYLITRPIKAKLKNAMLFLSTTEPALSDILMPTRGGKPKTKKNKQSKRRRTSKRNKRI
jgi:hypothetical protein